MKRLLDWAPEDLAASSGPALLEAIRASEGRTIMAEVLWPAPSLAGGSVGNPEVLAAFGADLLLLNRFDGEAGEVRRRTGRPVGVNVEPAEDLPEHRRASPENLARLRGADFVVVTANPSVRTSHDEMLAAVATAREVLGDTPVFAGRMHGSGGRGLLGPDEVGDLAEAADGVLVPAPGTVPGSREEVVAGLVDVVHRAGRLAVAAVGTSQEDADPETVRTLALAAKRAGADVLHLGDGGMLGIADPANLLAASLAIRGRRHTYRRMATR